MRAENFNVDEVIDYLQGTCMGISSCFGSDGLVNEDFTPKYPDMTEDDLIDEDYDRIDNSIFLCPYCSWWCEVGDWQTSPSTGEDICNDCYSEEYGDPEE